MNKILQGPYDPDNEHVRSFYVHGFGFGHVELIPQSDLIRDVGIVVLKSVEPPIDETSAIQPYGGVQIAMHDFRDPSFTHDVIRRGLGV